MCISTFGFVFISVDQTFALCADQRGVIRCENESKIKIVSASYGRTDDKVCPGGKTNTITCRSKSSEIKVKRNCNGYATCHLQATNGYFGDPCANIFKYLEVRYRCVKNIDKEVKGRFKIWLFIQEHVYAQRYLGNVNRSQNSQSVDQVNSIKIQTLHIIYIFCFSKRHSWLSKKGNDHTKQ